MSSNTSQNREPRGLGEHARGPAAERAHEMGWDLNEEERTQPAAGTQNAYGGEDYNYGAQDFGDSPRRMGNATDPVQTRKALDRLLKED